MILLAPSVPDGDVDGLVALASVVGWALSSISSACADKVGRELCLAVSLDGVCSFSGAVTTANSAVVSGTDGEVLDGGVFEGGLLDGGVLDGEVLDDVVEPLKDSEI